MTETHKHHFQVADVGDWDLDQDRSIVPSIHTSLKASGITAVVDGDEMKVVKLGAEHAALVVQRVGKPVPGEQRAAGARQRRPQHGRRAHTNKPLTDLMIVALALLDRDSPNPHRHLRYRAPRPAETN